jgi:cobaltochelatase CobN
MLATKVAIKTEKAGRLVETLKLALEIVDRIRASGPAETAGLLAGLEGGYVEPGPSGALTRGKVEVLPTGRNFFAVDPTQIPTPAAWKVGVESAERLVRYYRERYGKYPESVGEVLWSIDAYKADGEQLSQILWLMGVQPVWAEDGSVKGVEVVPLEKLGRPRIDAVARISGIVRDTLPNYAYLIDEAVSKVIALDEPLDMNFVKKHYLETLEKLKAAGVDKPEERARARVYGEPPGAYGAGVNYAVEASAWRTDEDLMKVWLQWGSYAYTRAMYGEMNVEAFVAQLSKVDVINRNHISDEHDIFNCCCYFAYHGGFYNAVKALTGRSDIEIVTVDTRDVSNIEVRGMREEIERVVRAKLLNPVWISEMMKHGYRGANEIQRKILHLYGWSATTKLVDKWVYDELVRTYVLDERMRKWFMENNIYALEEIVRRFIEAAQRGLWRADAETLERLNEIYSEIEAVLEADVTGEVQGGSIDVYTHADVPQWGEAVKRVEEALARVRK